MSIASEINVNVGGDQSSVVVSSTEGSEISVLGPEGLSITVDTPDSQSISISQTSGLSLSVGVPDTSTVITTGNDVINVSVDPIPAVDKVTRLRDLDDVVGTPSSNQVLVYNQGENNFQFADQSGDGSESDGLIDEFIDVTNTDGAFSALVALEQDYEVGTSVTKILKDILDPYKILSLEMNYLNYRYLINNVEQNTTFSSSVNDTVEVGSNIRVSGFNYDTSNETGYVPGSSSFTLDGAVLGVATGLIPVPDTSGGTFNLTSNSATQKNSPADLKGFMSAKEEGPSDYSGQLTVNSNEATIKFRYRAFLIANSLDLSASLTNSDFNSLFNDEGFKYVGEADGTVNNFSMNTPSDSDEINNYTYLAYPTSFGELDEVVEEGSFPVLGDLVKLSGPLADGGFQYEGPNGQNTSYLVYQSDEKQAFSNDVELTLKF